MLSMFLQLVLARKGDDRQGQCFPAFQSKEYMQKLISPNNNPLFPLVEDVTGHMCEF